jgi:hypothetical protein
MNERQTQHKIQLELDRVGLYLFPIRSMFIILQWNKMIRLADTEQNKATNSLDIVAPGVKSSFPWLGYLFKLTYCKHLIVLSVWSIMELTSPKEDSRKKQDGEIMQMRLVRVNKHLPQLQAELHHHQHTPYYSIVPVKRTITFVLENAKSSIQIHHNLQKCSKLTKFSEHCISSWLPEDTLSSESYFRTQWTCQKTAGGRSVENTKNISNKNHTQQLQLEVMCIQAYNTSQKVDPTYYKVTTYTYKMWQELSQHLLWKVCFTECGPETAAQSNESNKARLSLFSQIDDPKGYVQDIKYLRSINLIADKTILTFSGNLYWERKEEE